MYYMEMARQHDLSKDLKRMDKDIRKFDRQNVPAEVAIKNFRRRPKTAKPTNTLLFNVNGSID